MAKKIRVRIPAVVSPDGRWCANGYPGAMTAPDWAMCEEMADNGDEPCFEYKRIWITAELVLPEASEVEALAVEPHDPQ